MAHRKGNRMQNQHNPYGKLGITARVALPYDEAIARAKEALKVEGFGVLTEIDVKETLKSKLGVDFRPYRILGACNPGLAHRALEASPAVGLLLPCNVVVEQTDDGCLVSAMDPEEGLSAVGAADVEPIAREAREKLSRAIASLEAGK